MSSSGRSAVPHGRPRRRPGQANARHGSDLGVTFDTHVSDQFAPFQTTLINAAVRDDLGQATPPRPNRLWRRAERLRDQALDDETAWEQAQSAVEFSTPEGRLNDRGQADAVVTATLPHLCSPAWAKTWRLCRRRESFTSLEQAHQRLAGLGLASKIVSALLDLEGLRRQPWRLSEMTPSVGLS